MVTSPLLKFVQMLFVSPVLSVNGVYSAFCILFRLNLSFCE